MNRRGFTLTELLVVIIILTLVIVIAVPIVVSNINVSKKKTYNCQVAMFIECAKRYTLEYNDTLIWKEDTDNAVTSLTLIELSDKGYIDLPVTNPVTDKEFNPETTKVIIYKDKYGSLTFEYDD